MFEDGEYQYYLYRKTTHFSMQHTRPCRPFLHMEVEVHMQVHTAAKMEVETRWCIAVERTCTRVQPSQVLELWKDRFVLSYLCCWSSFSEEKIAKYCLLKKHKIKGASLARLGASLATLGASFQMLNSSDPVDKTSFHSISGCWYQAEEKRTLSLYNERKHHLDNLIHTTSFQNH